MVVALDKTLEHLRAGLEKYGITTEIYGEYSGYIDALLYNGNVDISEIINNTANGEDGVFLINAKDKKVSEIYDILVRKTYSPLFGL